MLEAKMLRDDCEKLISDFVSSCLLIIKPLARTNAKINDAITEYSVKPIVTSNEPNPAKASTTANTNFREVEIAIVKGRIFVFREDMIIALNRVLIPVEETNKIATSIRLKLILKVCSIQL